MTARRHSAEGLPATRPAQSLTLRIVAGLAGLVVAVWLGMQPLGQWMTRTPLIAPMPVVPVSQEFPQSGWRLAELLQGQRWLAESPDQMRRRFRVQVSPAMTTDETLYLWVPQFEQRLRVMTPNGHLLHDSIVSGFRGGPIRTAAALVAVPPEIMAASGGVLDLEVDAELNRIGALGPVYVGPWRDLAASVYRMRLLENTLRPAMLGALLFLAIMSVVFVVLRPGDEIYRWLAGTMIPYAGIELGLITAYLPSLSEIDEQMFAIAAIGTLQLIGLLLTFKQRPPSHWISVGLFAIYGLLFVATFVISTASLVQLSLAMVGLSALAIVLFLVFFGFETKRGRRLKDVAIAVAVIVFVVGIVHDLMLKFGVHDQGLYVFRYVSFGMLVGIFGFVVQLQSGIADALDESNEHLRNRLRDQEVKLAEYHHREADLLQTRAAEAERQRITADLHDGMAGYLATIVALSERERSEKQEISHLAKDALTDLRFVIDATSISSPELRLTLAILRERCLQPLDGLGIDLGWSMIELPDDVHLSHEDNLHVLRILQEALNNAVRHGDPSHIDVTGRAIQDPGGATMVELVMENRGGRAPDPTRASVGYGTGNMAKRATALRGSIEVTPLPDGARLRLIFPVGL